MEAAHIGAKVRFYYLTKTSFGAKVRGHSGGLQRQLRARCLPLLPAGLALPGRVTGAGGVSL